MFLIWWYNCSRYLGLFLIAMLEDKGIVLDDFEAILKHWMIKWTFISKWHSDFESQTLCIFFFLEDTYTISIFFASIVFLVFLTSHQCFFYVSCRYNFLCFVFLLFNNYRYQQSERERFFKKS